MSNIIIFMLDFVLVFVLSFFSAFLGTYLCLKLVITDKILRNDTLLKF